MNLTLVSPAGTSVDILQEDCLVANYPNFVFGLSDLANLPFTCASVTDGISFTPTNSFGVFNGENPLGNWNLITYTVYNGFFNVLTFNYCTISASCCLYSRDIARSNLNIPGYLYNADSGLASFTTAIRNSNSEELTAIISRSVDGILVM